MVNMEIIITEDPATCCNCKNATIQIPSINRWSDPYCSKEHGQCKEYKTCNDYVIVNGVCGRCEFIAEKGRDLICLKHNIKVDYSGKVCDDFKFDSYRKFSSEDLE